MYTILTVYTLPYNAIFVKIYGTRIGFLKAWNADFHGFGGFTRIFSV
ncbi:MAG: hypothetical protein FWG87_00950 [Defluviitaleaceae bacterium]|nr:hypothetical protein [Defluviitaleaceae bacterium]